MPITTNAVKQRLLNNEIRRTAQKELMIKIIDLLKQTDDFSYTQVAEIIGVTKERVRQLFNEYGFDDYKTIRRFQKQRKKDEQIILDTQYLSSLGFDEETIKRLIESKSLRTKRHLTSRGLSEFNTAIKAVRDSGFIVEEHTVYELTDYMHSKGILLRNDSNDIRAKLGHNKIKYKKVARAQALYRDEFVNDMLSTGVDFKKGNARVIYEALLLKGLLKDNISYNTFYQRLTRYGLI